MPFIPLLPGRLRKQPCPATFYGYNDRALVKVRVFIHLLGSKHELDDWNYNMAHPQSHRTILMFNYLSWRRMKAYKLQVSAQIPLYGWLYVGWEWQLKKKDQPQESLKFLLDNESQTEIDLQSSFMLALNHLPPSQRGGYRQQDSYCQTGTEGEGVGLWNMLWQSNAMWKVSCL